MHIFKLLLERINAFFAKHSNILGIRSKTFFNISIINTNELVTGVLHYHQLCKIYCVTSVGKIAASYGYNYVEAYIDVFVVYIIVCTLAFSYAKDILAVIVKAPSPLGNKGAC